MRWIGQILIWLAAAAVIALPAPAGAAVTDSEVKAAFLPRFARYVTWPESAAPDGGRPFVL